MTFDARSKPRTRTCEIIAWAIVAFIAFQQILGVWLTLTQAPDAWVDYFQDDAYYYLSIARNLTEHADSSFSWHLRTNGYQPLWLIMMTGASALVGSDRVLLVVATHLLALAAMASFLFLSRRHHGVIWPAALVMLLFPNVMSAGMETALIPPLALLYFQATTARRKGVFASLLFLARLDALALVLGRAAYDFIAKRRIKWADHAVLLAVIAGYMIINLIIFGIPVPVSGLAKAVGNLPGENLPTSLRLIRRAYPTLLALVPLACLWWSKRYRFRHPAGVVSTLIATVACAVYYGVFSGWPLWSWYLWPVVMAAYFCLLEFSQVAARLDQAYKRVGEIWRVVAVGLIVTQFPAAFWVYHTRLAPLRATPEERAEVQPSYGQDNVRMADRLNKSAIQAATFVMGDRAGSLGYFLDDRFGMLQSEGLVGNAEQLRHMRADRSKTYIDAKSPEWLVVDRDQPFYEIAGQLVIEEPFQGLSVHRGGLVMCFPVQSRVPGHLFASGRKYRYFFRYALNEACSPAARQWFEHWEASYHGPVRGDLGLPPLFMNVPGDY